jgi:tricorn protease
MRQRHYIVALLAFSVGAASASAGVTGYYRQPALHKDTLVFVSEGDLWKVSAKGGTATRLTTHHGEEGLPAISPDGKTIAFLARYDGPAEVFTMPMTGGRPRRRTWGAGAVTFIGWTPDGKLIYSTDSRSTLPSQQLIVVDPEAKGNPGKVVPLAQAADGCYDEAGKTLFFTRLPFQGSHTRRYKGGTAQKLWKFTTGDDEALPLTSSYAGTSKNPSWWKGRLYFASDRTGAMNLWSMKPNGSDLQQHTKHKVWDIFSPSLSEGRFAYQLGADIWLFDLAEGKGAKVEIKLESDLDQTREQWIKRPTDYMTAAHLSPDGDRVVLTARGQVFVVPVKKGRFVEASRKQGVRYRDARFLPDGKSLLTLGDQSGEVELWKLPARGVGRSEQLTRDGEVLRWQGVPSPNGRWIAHFDKNQRLFLYDTEGKKNKLIEESVNGPFSGLAWSPDSGWLAYVVPATNRFQQIKVYEVAGGRTSPVTTDRFDSFSPAWSTAGRWLYFLSDRNLRTVVPSPWGNYQPEPFLDKKTKIYQLALREGLRSPFQPADELSRKKPEEVKRAPKQVPEPVVPAVKIELEGIQARLNQVPVPPGNYRNLKVNAKGLFWQATNAGSFRASLSALPIAQDAEVKTVADGVGSYELSQDGKKMLLQVGQSANRKLYVVDATPAPAVLAKKEVDLSGWSLSVTPREEWRQMFDEAWRLERDYFYDRGMHGVDWKKTRQKFLPLVNRVHSRAELSDLIAQMVAELSALHIFVRGGDLRSGSTSIAVASLGARLERDDDGGGYRVREVYQTDPDEPDRLSPLARPGVRVGPGDVIEAVDGTDTLDAIDIGRLLRNKAGKQVLLRVKPAKGAKSREVIVRPITQTEDADLRYHEWEYTRRLEVDEKGKGDLGYLHLRAMGGGNYTEWAKGYFPVFDRKGLIIDVRHNRGGNIDSWILSRLLRRPWFYWSDRVSRKPRLWNMQFAFRGHVVVLVNERTASDGEAFAEGFRRLGLGKVIGTRTWGGEIWLSASNFLVDQGIATSAEFGVFGPEGTWLIEGHGVEPDIVVDNLPHATFKGKDAQLEAAIAYLKKRIKEKPIPDVVVPKYPDKSLPGENEEKPAKTNGRSGKK